MYKVYVLQSTKDNTLYIGYTENLDRRINEHNLGLSCYTNQHKPYKCITAFSFLVKTDAERFEEYLKSGYGRRFLKSMLKDYLCLCNREIS